MADDVLGRPCATEQHIADEVAAILRLDGADGERLRDRERRHSSGALEDRDVAGEAVGVAANDDEPSVVGRPGHQSDYRHRQLADPMRAWSESLGTESPRLGEEIAVVGQRLAVGPGAAASTRPSGVVTKERPAISAWSASVSSSSPPPCKTTDTSARPIASLRSRQARLALQHLADDLGQQVVKRHVVGKEKHREARCIGGVDHVAREVIEVAAQLDGQGRDACGVKGADQLGETLWCVAQRVSGGHQQLARLDPRDDVGDFHDVGALDSAIESRRAGDDGDLGECRQPEDVADTHAEVLDGRLRRAKRTARAVRSVGSV